MPLSISAFVITPLIGKHTEVLRLCDDIVILCRIFLLHVVPVAMQVQHLFRQLGIIWRQNSVELSRAPDVEQALRAKQWHPTSTNIMRWLYYFLCPSWVGQPT